MIIVGQTVVERDQDLWDLIARCQSLLGDAASLMAWGEHATASRLMPWTDFIREPWTLGHVFGERGELRWRAYGPLLRTVLITETTDSAEESTAQAERLRARLKELGFADPAILPLNGEDGHVFLWRHEPYVKARIRHYLDADGNASFVRYCEIFREQEHGTNHPGDGGNLPGSG
jgi:hypothetical protein